MVSEIEWKVRLFSLFFASFYLFSDFDGGVEGAFYVSRGVSLTQHATNNVAGVGGSSHPTIIPLKSERISQDQIFMNTYSDTIWL